MFKMINVFFIANYLYALQWHWKKNKKEKN